MSHSRVVFENISRETKMAALGIVSKIGIVSYQRQERRWTEKKKEGR